MENQDIKKLAKEFLISPAIVEVSQRRDIVDFIVHRAYKVDKARKAELVAKLIEDKNLSQVLLFASSKEHTNKIYEYLKSRKIRTSIIHGDLNRGARAKSLALLKSGKTQVLVATDIAARGIDIDQLPHVVNYELPNVPEDYVHRIGRTGRAGQSGEAVSLVCIDEHKLLFDIEKFIKSDIKKVHIEAFTPDPNIKAEPIQNGRGGGNRGGGGSRNGNSRNKPRSNASHANNGGGHDGARSNSRNRNRNRNRSEG